jgi:hypothetical protein
MLDPGAIFLPDIAVRYPGYITFDVLAATPIIRFDA